MEKKLLAVLLSLVLLCQPVWGEEVFVDGASQAEEWDISEVGDFLVSGAEEDFFSAAAPEEQEGMPAEAGWEVSLDEGFQALAVEDEAVSDAVADGIGESQSEIKNGCYINPKYADVITEADLLPIPEEYSSADALVGATAGRLFTDTKSLEAYLRSQMVQRIPYVSFEYSEAIKEKEEVAKQARTMLGSVFNAAQDHTGVPTEGDYIGWQLGGCLYNSTLMLIDESTYTIAVFLSITYYTTAEQEKMVTDAVKEWLGSWDPKGMSDYEKIKKVYDFVTATVDYDYENVNNKSYYPQWTAYNALILKRAVCQGYGVLIYRLLLELGIDCRCITSENHLWNIVKIGNLYYNLDATWEEDAGKEGLKYEYFLRGNTEKLFPDHIPENIYTEKFWEKYPMSQKDYDTEPASQSSPLLSSGECGEGLTWKLHENGVLEIAGQGDMQDYAYEEKEGEYVTTAPWGTKVKRVLVGSGVKSIGAAAFCGCKDLRHVKLPNGLISIKAYAFWNCETLMFNENILPGSVESIGDRAFTNCKGLTVLNLPEGLSSLGENVFGGCRSLKSITFPDNLKAMGDSAFTLCLSLGDVKLPKNLLTIGANTFRGCESFVDIEIPEGVTGIGDASFKDCKSLRTVLIPKSVLSLGQSCFDNCPDLTIYGEMGSEAEAYAKAHQIPFMDKGKFPLKNIIDSGKCGNNLTWTLDQEGRLTISGLGYMNDFSDVKGNKAAPWGRDISEVILENGIQSIGEYAFYQCANLKSIHIPQTMRSLKWGAFKDCTGITELSIPDNVSYIYNRCFQGCTGLTKVTWPANAFYISDSTFEGCTMLQHIEIPEGVTIIESSSFENCKSLTKLTLPESLHAIGKFAFTNCIGLENIKIPENVVFLDSFAFSRCTGLKSVTLPKAMTAINASVFSGCKNLKTIQGLTSIKYIGDYAFTDCEKLKAFPCNLADLTLLGKAAFANCKEMTGTFDLKNLHEIPDGAFYHCKHITKVEIPKQVVFIGDDAFENCNALKIYGIPESLAEVYAKSHDIPFKSQGGTSATDTVKGSVTLNQKKKTLYVDSEDQFKSFEPFQLTAKVKGAKGDVIFASSNEKIATVGRRSGLIDPKAKGKVTVTAYLETDSRVKASCQVTVKNVEWKLADKSVKVQKGKTYKLKYTLKKPKSGVLYVDVAKCKKVIKTEKEDGYYKITGLKKGTGTLYVFFGNQKKTVKITVT